MENIKKQIQSILEKFQSGNLAKAEALCKKVIGENPNVAYLYNLLGLIYVGQKKIDSKRFNKNLLRHTVITPWSQPGDAVVWPIVVPY